MHPAAAWAALIFASLGVLLGGAELMVVAIALPSIVADFGGWADLARVSWIINAYLLATTVFGNRGNGANARIAAEFMGTEAVHRALARQSNGKLGNDRVFMRYSQVEDADSAARGTPGFTRALSHVRFLESRGLGFGKMGAQPGAFYEFDQVSARTPDDPGLSTRTQR